MAASSGKDRDDVGASLELAIKPFDGVGRVDLAPMALRRAELDVATSRARLFLRFFRRAPRRYVRCLVTLLLYTSGASLRGTRHLAETPKQV